MAHAGFFVASQDLHKLNKIKDLPVRSVRNYKHIRWSYVDVAPEAAGRVKKMAASQQVQLIPDGVIKLSNMPSDPRVIDQIYLNPGLPITDIHASGGWDILTTSTVDVAVIDSGIQADHEDLVANIWTNAAEANGTPGYDDDHNGYIDDMNGWNTVEHNANINDTFSHGTRVAGIIGARAQNNIGIAGICWGVKLVTVRAFEGTTGTLSAVVDGFDYIFATAPNVRVVNCSFGDDSHYPPLYDCLNVANSRGILVIAAAGNNSRDIDLAPFYPASYNLPNIIAVGATDGDGQLWASSNFGNRIDIVAPGVGIESTTLGNSYDAGNGTSFAAPIVSGAAALMLTQWPLMPPGEAKRQLKRTTRMTPPLLSEQIGGGLLDMKALLIGSVSAATDWQLYR